MDIRSISFIILEPLQNIGHLPAKRWPVICDESKPLRPMADSFAGDGNEGILRYIEATQGKQISNWKFERPIEFVDSRAHPSVQLADNSSEHRRSSLFAWLT